MLKYETTRVNMNFPKELDRQVKEFGQLLGVPTTQAYVILVHQGLKYEKVDSQLTMAKEIVDKASNLNLENNR